MGGATMPVCCNYQPVDKQAMDVNNPMDDSLHGGKNSILKDGRSRSSRSNKPMSK